jgi:hypothetical protein
MSKTGEDFPTMMKAWANGDTEKLASMTSETLQKTPALYDAIFTNRNAKWADWVQQRMAKPGTVFVAVGAGHLAGKGSVQDFLAKKGIKAVKVRN